MKKIINKFVKFVKKGYNKFVIMVKYLKLVEFFDKLLQNKLKFCKLTK